MVLVLDEQLSFKAMAIFLAVLHEQLGWNDLPALLGSMTLIDGKPLDVAIAEDWRRAVEQVLTDSCSSTTATGLTIDQVYSATELPRFYGRIKKLSHAAWASSVVCESYMASTSAGVLYPMDESRRW